MDFLRDHQDFQGLIAAETNAPRPLLPPAEITAAIPFPMDFPRFVIFQSPDRAASRGEGAVMMEGAGQLTGATAITFFRKPLDLHFESEWEKKIIVPAEQIHYKPP
jgi:hypothetical protein